MAILAQVLFLLFGSGGGSAMALAGASLADQSKEIEALKAEITRLHSRVALLEEELVVGRNLLAALENKLRFLKGRLDRLLQFIVDTLTTLALELRLQL